MTEFNPTLTPGAIWIKASKKNKKRVFSSTILCVTNLDRSEEFQADNPPQVVFLSDAREITSMSIDAFTKDRTFHDMDSNMEALMEAVVSDPEDEEGIDDLDETEIEADGGLPPSEEGSDDASEQQSSTANGPNIGFSENRAPTFALTEVHELSDVLQRSFVHYEERLPTEEGARVHILKFRLSNELTKEQLIASFGEEDTDSPASINGFILRADTGVSAFNVDGFIAVMSELTAYGSEVGIVYVTSNVNTAEETTSDAKSDEPVTIIAPEVVVTASENVVLTAVAQPTVQA